MTTRLPHNRFHQLGDRHTGRDCVGIHNDVWHNPVLRKGHILMPVNHPNRPFLSGATRTLVANLRLPVLANANLTELIAFAIDTIIIPTGYVVKLEGDNICHVSNQGYLFNGTGVALYGVIDLKISGINKPAILSQYPYFSYQNSNKIDSFPMWLGSGVHYLHFSNGNSYTSSIRYSLQGLLFQIQ